jgi:hypothetical protein
VSTGRSGCDVRLRIAETALSVMVSMASSSPYRARATGLAIPTVGRAERAVPGSSAARGSG